MKEEYSTQEICDLADECGHDKRWMEKRWKPIKDIAQMKKPKYKRVRGYYRYKITIINGTKAEVCKWVRPYIRRVAQSH